ncbi:MAG: GGDEF domain-containing protein [Spirochaetales bacterium]|nr:GGDEF domain-containing protein [Spirochaetales bacterium]
MNKLIPFLRNINALASLKDNELEIFLEKLVREDFAQGTDVFHQGDEGKELFLIMSGKIGSYIDLPNKKQKEICAFTSGNFFGEMAIFDKAPRSATCKALEDSSLLKMNEDDFFSLMEAHPDISIKTMYKMLNTISQRLRNTGQFLSDMVRWGNEASKRAVTDEFTGVYNRRFLDTALQNYFEEAVNIEKPLTLVMSDLDFFREINEAYGHEMGDRVLLEAVKAYKRHIRKSDVIARYGGDEFALIFPETPAEEAALISERIRADLEKLDLFDGQKGPVAKLTTSMGCAAYPLHAVTLEDLRHRADEALYQAKEGGKNRVAILKV